jgi:hypothetical protein
LLLEMERMKGFFWELEGAYAVQRQSYIRALRYLLTPRAGGQIITPRSCFIAENENSNDRKQRLQHE